MPAGVLAACWSKAVSTPGLSDDERRRIIHDGLSAGDASLTINPAQADILALKGLLLRLLATIEPGAATRQSLTAAASSIHRLALEVHKSEVAHGAGLKAGGGGLKG